jgi:deoxyadenosine kinase
MVEVLSLPRPRIIGIGGIIGAGKSTLTDAVAARIRGSIAMHEPVPDQEGGPANPYLSDFYRDKRKHAFAMQIYLLQARYIQHLKAATCGQTVIQDRTIYEDTVFAEMMHDAGYIDDRDWFTYLSLYHAFSLNLIRPDLIIYLDVSPQVAYARVMKRNRPAEAGMDIDYLHSLQVAYERWIEMTKDLLPIVRVAWDADFLPAEDILDVIARETQESRRIADRYGAHA